MDWDARELFSLDGDSAEINADSMIESSTDTDPAELDDFDPWAMFSVDEDAEASNSDYVTDSRTMNERSRHTDLLEKSFLSGLQGDTESDIILGEETIETADADAKPSAEQDIQNEFTVRFPEERGIMRLEQQLQEAFDQAVQERLAKEGAELLDKGGMPSEEQLQAMGMDEATARGFQVRVWLSTKNNPVARRKVEAMIDQTAPEIQLEQQKVDSTRVPVGVNAHTLNGFDDANGSTGLVMINTENFESGDKTTKGPGQSLESAPASDYYVGPNGKVLPAQYKDWIGTNMQQELLKKAQNLH